MVLSVMEIIDLVIMTAALGFIFKDIFKQPKKTDYDPLIHHQKSSKWDDFKFAALVTGPAIILHEMGHKFVAMAMGLKAVFHASYGFLGLGVLLKLLNFNFLFVVPGYVQHVGEITQLQSSLVAFAGPGVNLLLWIITAVILKTYANHQTVKKYHKAIFLTSRINMFLFFLNMLPIPPFDGFKVFSGLYHAFF